MQLSYKQVFRELKSYSVLTLGMFVYAFSWITIITPAKFISGGITGVSLILFYATGGEEGGGIPIGISYIIINGCLLLIGSLVLGWVFGVKTIFCTLAISFFLTIGQQYFPGDLFGISDDKLLSAILGGLLCGWGISRAVVEGGSSGGTDILAMIINKFKTISFGTIIVAFDIIIVGSSYFITNDITTIIYGYVSTIVLGYAADVSIGGRKRTCQITIISPLYTEISDAIIKTGRGVTLMDAQGWYTKKDQKVIMVFCRAQQAREIQYIAKDIDENAFISIANVSGVWGNGFEKLLNTGKKKKQTV